MFTILYHFKLLKSLKRLQKYEKETCWFCSVKLSFDSKVSSVCLSFWKVNKLKIKFLKKCQNYKKSEIFQETQENLRQPSQIMSKNMMRSFLMWTKGSSWLICSTKTLIWFDSRQILSFTVWQIQVTSVFLIAQCQLFCPY